jgi:hypothetical protein
MSTSSRDNDRSDEELAEYWTEERRAGAIPKPLPDLSQEIYHKTQTGASPIVRS